MKKCAKLLTFFAVVLFLGCTSLNTQTGGPSVASSPPASSSRQASQSPSVLPPSPSPLTTPSPVMPIFYDFKDVPVPPNFSLMDKESSVLQTTGYKTGVLVFKGRVNYNSVVDFYMSAMSREGWKLKGSSRYSHSIMVFEKPQKLCVINIYPKFMYTYLEIYVLPTQSM